MRSKRKVKDQQVTWMNELARRPASLQEELQHRHLHLRCFQPSGSRRRRRCRCSARCYMMLIVLVLSLPIGVAASIYLEEFAPKNQLTDLIEVNINNLAAVPSIVYGLLGLAVFINFAGMPRSAAARRRPGADADDPADDHHRHPCGAEARSRRRSARQRSVSARRRCRRSSTTSCRWRCRAS